MARAVSRSARTGRFVKASTTRRNRRTTITESVGRGTKNAKVVYRSATSGRFVKAATARRNPATTIRQRV